eukprot:scaffold19579_cov52-Attheya_sp.AAC.6
MTAIDESDISISDARHDCSHQILNQACGLGLMSSEGRWDRLTELEKLSVRRPSWSLGKQKAPVAPMNQSPRIKVVVMPRQISLDSLSNASMRPMQGRSTQTPQHELVDARRRFTIPPRFSSHSTQSVQRIQEKPPFNPRGFNDSRTQYSVNQYPSQSHPVRPIRRDSIRVTLPRSSEKIFKKLASENLTGC